MRQCFDVQLNDRPFDELDGKLAVSAARVFTALEREDEIETDIALLDQGIGILGEGDTDAAIGFEREVAPYCIQFGSPVSMFDLRCQTHEHLL
jgi:hypothetical protein